MKLNDFKNLDPNSMGSWPLLAKALVLLVLSIAVLGTGFYFDTQDQIVQLDGVEKKEGELKQTFDAKQRRAANLIPLEKQLKEMKQTFGAMLRLLPNKTEIEGLLVDISQSGLAAGLEFDLFKPLPETKREFYAIQPITLTVSGKYHEFGEFVSAVAALPRIVTQHDLSFERKGKGDTLVMRATAKTYRYLEESELEGK